MSTIEIRNLSKNYGKTRALSDISLRFPAGKIYGFLGRNGAGKTTLLNILTNRIFADAGQALLDGESVVENDNAQSKIFYVTEKTLYLTTMKVKEIFQLTKEFYPTLDMPYAHSLAGRFQLDLGKKVEALSTGYKSILKLILGLAANTPLLLLDEPVLGLDANHRDLFYRELIARFDPERQTVILSTHLIQEAAPLIEEVVIIDEGKILLNRPVEDVLRLAYTVSGKQEVVDQFSAGKKVIREEQLGAYKATTIFQERATADGQQMAKLGLELSQAPLQEVFISLTNSPERLSL